MVASPPKSKETPSTEEGVGEAKGVGVELGVELGGELGEVDILGALADTRMAMKEQKDEADMLFEPIDDVEGDQQQQQEEKEEEKVEVAEEEEEEEEEEVRSTDSQESRRFRVA